MYENLIRTKQGRLSVVSFADADAHGHKRVNCVCDCGKQIVAAATYILQGKIKSCGCLRGHRRQAKKRKPSDRPSKTRRPEYNSWIAMIQRCTEPTNRFYHRYGGRGIVVCERWIRSFDAFLLDVGEKPSNKHSIDRINNDRGYEPGNVRWATPTEQHRNTTRNTFIEYEGQRRCIAEWSELTGIHRDKIRRRLLQGMPADQILAVSKK